MEYLEIKSEDSVGVKIIDEQHRNIADVVNQMHQSILKLDKKQSVKNLIELLELLENHFETEESMMKGSGFPGYISHKLEHDRFYRQILTATDNYKKGNESFGLEQLKGIKRWFFNHIEINDKKCGKFFVEKGIN